MDEQNNKRPSPLLVGAGIVSAVCVGLFVYVNFIAPSEPPAERIDVAKYASLTCEDWSAMTPQVRAKAADDLLAFQVSNTRGHDKVADEFGAQLSTICANNPSSQLVPASLAAYLAP